MIDQGAIYLGYGKWWRWSGDGRESCRKHIDRRKFVLFTDHQREIDKLLSRIDHLEAKIELDAYEESESAP